MFEGWPSPRCVRRARISAFSAGWRRRMSGGGEREHAGVAGASSRRHAAAAAPRRRRRRRELGAPQIEAGDAVQLRAEDGGQIDGLDRDVVRCSAFSSVSSQPFELSQVLHRGGHEPAGGRAPRRERRRHLEDARELVVVRRAGEERPAGTISPTMRPQLLLSVSNGRRRICASPSARRARGTTASPPRACTSGRESGRRARGRSRRA